MIPQSRLQSNEIPHSSHSHSSGSETKLNGDATPVSGEMPVDADWPTLSTLSRRYIDQALKYTGGNKTRAADLLGIDRRTLNRILARERTRKGPPKVAAK